MSIATLENALQRLTEARLTAHSFSVLWHSGEPLVISRDWYSEAFSVFKHMLPLDVVRHNFQTNATLITDKWCDFILWNDIRVGVSIDGPRELNDLSRRTRNKDGTYDRIMYGIRCLQRAEVPVHAICVLTRAHLQHPDAVFDFFVENGIRELGFNIEEIDGINLSSSLDVADAEVAFSHFFSRIVERYRANPDAIAIREIDRVIAQLENGGDADPAGNTQTRPFAIVSIAWNGDISTFSPELLSTSHPRYGPFSYGNVNIHTLDDVLANRRLGAVAAEIARGVSRCRRTCPYFAFCGGGAPSNKLGETGRFDSTVTKFCTLTQMLTTEIVLRALEDDLDKLIQNLRKRRLDQQRNESDSPQNGRLFP